MKLDKMIESALEMPRVPLPFGPAPIKRTATNDYPGAPTLAAHHCPACRQWASYDRNSGLCQTCHGALRLSFAIARMR